jgi:hypothetical protein
MKVVLQLERKVLHDPIQPSLINPIVIKKDEAVIEALIKLSEGNTRFKGISPSALNTYIECRLRFYLRHVAKVKEPDEVEEDLDARVLGNFLHEVMELFYRQLQDKKQSMLWWQRILPTEKRSLMTLLIRSLSGLSPRAWQAGRIRRTTIGGEGNRKTVRASHFGNGQRIRPLRNRSIGTRRVGIFGDYRPVSRINVAWRKN